MKTFKIILNLLVLSGLPLKAAEAQKIVKFTHSENSLFHTTTQTVKPPKDVQPPAFIKEKSTNEVESIMKRERVFRSTTPLIREMFEEKKRIAQEKETDLILAKLRAQVPERKDAFLQELADNEHYFRDLNEDLRALEVKNPLEKDGYTLIRFEQTEEEKQQKKTSIESLITQLTAQNELNELTGNLIIVFENILLHFAQLKAKTFSRSCSPSTKEVNELAELSFVKNLLERHLETLKMLNHPDYGYTIVAKELFINELQQPFIESMRRCANSAATYRFILDVRD